RRARLLAVQARSRPMTDARLTEPELLERARSGDEDAFGRLVTPYRAQLQAHNYRMLGSVHDAEDALQETLLNAWRALPRFEGRSSPRAGLNPTATSASLGVTERGRRRGLRAAYAPPADPHDRLGEPLLESVWVEPLLDETVATSDGLASPEARYEQRES